MHSGGLELSKLAYTRLEDTLMRHLGEHTTECYHSAMYGGDGGLVTYRTS